jgi:hypothetical protein
MKKLTSKNAKLIGEDLGIDWNEVKLDEFTIGINVEFEHGTKYPETNITKNDKKMTGKIAWAHLKEFPSKLNSVEPIDPDVALLAFA